MTATFTAHFTPEAWVRDYAVEVDAEGPTSWDVTAAVARDPEYWARLSSKAGGWGADPSGVLDNDDVLKHDPAAPEWVRGWGGPFTILVTCQDATQLNDVGDR